MRINTKPSQTLETPFVVWWRSAGCHEFPEMFKDVLAAGFAAGVASEKHRLREVADSLISEVKSLADDIEAFIGKVVDD